MVNIASASEDHLVQIWEAESGKLFKEILHEEGIDGLAWANHKMLLVTGEEGKLVKTASGEKTEAWIRVFEMPEGKEIFKKDLGGTINEIMFTDDDQYLLAAGHGFVRVFLTETMEEIQSLKAESFVKFVTADFSPDGQFIAAAGFGGNVYVWDWKKGELIKRFNYRGRKEESLTWHPNGEYLITSGHGSYINIFRKKDIFEAAGDEVQVAAQVFANDGAEYIHFNRSGSYMVSAHQDGIIRLWVWKGEDPNLNATRHRWVSEQQRKANEDKSKE